MLNLKKTTILVLITFTLACSSTKEAAENVTSQVNIQEGFALASDHNLPFDKAYTRAVVKILRGNSVIGNGTFVSNNGLLLSNYDPALFMAAQTAENSNILTGFSASNLEQELPIPGISILILKAEKDVTEEFSSRIPEQATNAQIAQLKRQISQNLINEARSEHPNTFVQITELYSGNRLILSTYHLLNDIRLVWSENLDLNEKQLANSKELYTSVSSSTALLRAYSNPTGVQEGFNTLNLPYTSTAHFTIAKETPASTPIVALGFPENTFRASPVRALSFYRDVVNPAILNSYRPFRTIQDSISATNTEYLYTSLYSRYSTISQINKYAAIQESLKNEDIITKKALIQRDFEEWLEADSTISTIFRLVNTSINQAYDIAEQSGASFYNISYSNQLNKIDDLVNQIKLFIEQSMNPPSDEEILELRTATLQNMEQIRNSMDISTELNFVSHTLATLKSLPESQQLPSLDGIFSDQSELSTRNQALRFLERQKNKTFLFDAEATIDAFNTNSFYSDSLFSVIDELLFINDMNRNNHAIFLSYLQPVQQVLNAAYLEYLGAESFPPDANGTLRFNIGYLDSNQSSSHPILTTRNDFSANAKGSAVFSTDGTLYGIVTNSTKFISGNYSFNEEHAFLNSISTFQLYDTWKNNFNSEYWFLELSN